MALCLFLVDSLFCVNSYPEKLEEFFLKNINRLYKEEEEKKKAKVAIIINQFSPIYLIKFSVSGTNSSWIHDCSLELRSIEWNVCMRPVNRGCRNQRKLNCFINYTVGPKVRTDCRGAREESKCTGSELALFGWVVDMVIVVARIKVYSTLQYYTQHMGIGGSHGLP